MAAVQPVILAGGSGTRLWPLSRRAYPKQFLALTGEQTMLQATLSRLDGFDPDIQVLPPLVVCNEVHRFLVAEQLRSAAVRAGRILLEPVARNTAPALTVAALEAAQADPVMIVMPADHLIRDQAALHAALRHALRHAFAGSLVSLGIAPDRPHTGYGYLGLGAPLDGGGYHLADFVEKPELPIAASFIARGDYLWNSGILVCKASRWLGLVRKYAADLASTVMSAYQAGRADLDFFRVDAGIFATLPALSIDHAVMEPLSKDGDGSVVIPLLAGWSDVGGWTALRDIANQDACGNAIHGDVMALDSQGSFVYAEHRFLATLGIRDLIVIETADAVLVADRTQAEGIGRIALQLDAQGRCEGQTHRRVHRPWGSYEDVDQGTGFKVKRLTVRPGGSLSLQLHEHRAEHWIVVSGSALVQCGDRSFLLEENQSTYIPIGIRHRLENPGTVPLEVIEVQSGAYLGEDDILRFDDLYNRGQGHS